MEQKSKQIDRKNIQELINEIIFPRFKSSTEQEIIFGIRHQKEYIIAVVPSEEVDKTLKEYREDIVAQLI